MSEWRSGGPGVLPLPSGRLVRGRGLRRPPLQGALPEFGVYLLNKTTRSCLVGSPVDPLAGLPAAHRPPRRSGCLREAWRRAANERVEIACSGGRGRTGTALACLAVLDGIPPPDAIAYVREHYDLRAVETPWQRRYVTRFPTS